MQTYLIYIHDRRYAVPNMEWLVAADERGAIELVGRRLASNAHYLAVELWQDDSLLARLP